MTSIRRWLLGWLIFGLAATSLVGGLSASSTPRAAKRASCSTTSCAPSRCRCRRILLPPMLPSGASHDFNGIADDRIAIDIWDKQGKLVYHSLKEPVLPRIADGFRSIERDDYRWRVFGLQQPDRYIQVAQPFSVREDLALRLAWRTLWPLALLVPVTIVLVLFVVARGLAPIGGLSRALSRRSLDSLEPLQAGRGAGGNPSAGRRVERLAAAIERCVAGAANLCCRRRARVAHAADRVEAAASGGPA